MYDDRFTETEMNDIIDDVIGSPLRYADVCPQCGAEPRINSATIMWPDLTYWLYCPKLCFHDDVDTKYPSMDIDIKLKLMSKSRYAAVRYWNAFCASDMRKHYMGQFC